MSDEDLMLRVEAVLMTADRPLGERRIATILELDDDTANDGGGAARQVRDAVESLNGSYEATGRSFRIERVAGGLQVMTLPTYTEDIARLRGARQQWRLSQAAMETLAIIAYRQPILRADLEAIRGVSCGEVLRGLHERRLVKIAGRAEELGRPILYGTTREFLETFGLASLDDLPQSKELRPKPAKKTASPEPSAPEAAATDSPPADSPSETVEAPAPADS